MQAGDAAGARDLMSFLCELGMERHAAALNEQGVSSIDDLKYIESDEELEEVLDHCCLKTIERRKPRDRLLRQKRTIDDRMATASNSRPAAADTDTAMPNQVNAQHE